jgi:hypothetical protein
MRKRWVPVLLGAAMILGTAGACEPPAPPGWEPPNIESVALSTTEIVAGAQFTLTVAVTDDNQVTMVEPSFHGPSEGEFGPYTSNELAVPCEPSDWAPSAVVEVEFTCTMPAIAPSGAWRLMVVVRDGEWQGGHLTCGCAGEHLDFDVVGGTTDMYGPALVSYEVAPAQIPVGSPFTVKVRTTDEHPIEPVERVVLWYAPGAASRSCNGDTGVFITPTIQEFTFNCPGQTVPVGVQEAHVTVRDAMGYPAYPGHVSFPLTFVAAE